MDDRAFDVITRRAAKALDRRSVLSLLAGAALVAIAPHAARANTGGGNNGGKGGGKGGCPVGHRSEPSPSRMS